MSDDIRDADLIEQLERCGKGLGYDAMRRHLAQTQSQRDAEAARRTALTPAQRKREDARRLLETDALNPETCAIFTACLRFVRCPIRANPITFGNMSAARAA